MKVVENSPQNVRNCTIFIDFLGGGGGACSQTPLTITRSFAARTMYTQKPNFFLGWAP